MSRQSRKPPFMFTSGARGRPRLGEETFSSGLHGYGGQNYRRGRRRMEQQTDGPSGAEKPSPHEKLPSHAMLYQGRDERRHMHVAHAQHFQSEFAKRKEITERKGSRVSGPFIARMDYRQLCELSKPSKSAKEVVHILSADLKGFQHSLETSNQMKKSPESYVEVVLCILRKLCSAADDPDTQELACVILGEVLSDRCSNFHVLLQMYTRKLAINYPLEVAGKVKILLVVFSSLLTHLPSSAQTTLPIDDLVKHSKLVTKELSHRLSQLKEHHDSIIEETTSRLEEARKQKQSDYFKVWDNSQYRQHPILPTAEEIKGNSPILRPSIIRSPYSNWEHYYDIQFRLLREDFVAPLRRGISTFRSGIKGRNVDISIYHKVQIQTPVFTRAGVCFSVQFDASRFKRSWEHSKRLIYGSLLCLSFDNFQDDVHFGVVAKRDPKDLQDGLVQVKFENFIDLLPHCYKTVFVMAESRAYFEASRHILRSLQTAEVDTMPFVRYLIDNQPSPVARPQYLLEKPSPVLPLQYVLESDVFSRAELHLLQRLSASSDNPEYDLRWLYSHGHSGHNVPVDILDKSAWPEAGELELDKSQLQAIQMALTQEVAVIQGPPGTGKTYIGLKIVQTLLQNRSVWDHQRSSPILVMCYTNHALDQFLEGILDHEVCTSTRARAIGIGEPPRVVRIGGQSSVERIQECNINNIKINVPGNLRSKRYLCQKEIEALAERIPWRSLRHACQKPISEFLVGPSGLKRLLPAMNPTHAYQLSQLAKIEDQRPYVLEIWLGLWEEKEVAVEELQTTSNAQSVITRDEYKDGLISAGVSQPEEKQKEEEEKEIEELIDITGEAEMAEQERVIDIDLYHAIDSTEREEESLHYDPFADYMTALETRNSAEGQIHSRPSTAMERKLCRMDQEQIKRILRSKHSTPPLEQDLEGTIWDVTVLEPQMRWQLFRLWVDRYQEHLRARSNDLFSQYEQQCTEFQTNQQLIDRHALENADVIGMTTTGAAKYQHILHLVKPKIVVVEEAAEVLESHIVSALNAGTQHLILIGDHKQLRPKPNEYDLAVKHHLDVSLFERLIINGMPHATLLIQHRMRPQIARLVHPHIYEKLLNHETVQHYPNIKGFDHNMFFFDHDHLEEEDEGLLSFANEYEAAFVAALCRHILNQGYQASKVTVLTAYTGQLLRIRSKMPKKDFEGIRIVNVDNFQGEENDIIILSLVRSNLAGKVGFLKQENRVCVALSRAKWGFYCFGNFKMLRRNVPIWDVILSDVESQGCLGSAFALYCQIHSETKFMVTEPKHFQELSPAGGCQMPCKTRLNCGHVCRLTCHVIDPDHSNYQCLKPCTKPCPEGHPCPLLCYMECQPCKAQVIRVLPLCKHEAEMMCHENVYEYRCQKQCDKGCEWGHRCSLMCSVPCKPCRVPVMKIVPRCKHEQSMLCSVDPSFFKCKHRCLQPCPKGHICQKVCHMGEPCGCQEIVVKKMPLCNHELVMPCSMPLLQCNVLVPKIMPKCSHTMMAPCSQHTDSISCNHHCERSLLCGHPCQKTCGEECESTKCTYKVPVKMYCGHSTSTECHRKDEVQRKILLGCRLPCPKPCQKYLPCGHKCKNRCDLDCTEVCTVEVEVTCLQGHDYKVRCFENQDPTKHSCKTKVEYQCKCGHIHSRACRESETCQCNEECSLTLICGHKCSGKCQDCFTTRIHKPCIYNVQVNRVCGHFGTMTCVGMTDHCTRECLLRCSHGPCKHLCNEPCPTLNCDEKCVSSCPHFVCRQPCSEPCDYPPCKKPCTNTLPCGHHCPGLCGEPCDGSLCIVCKKDQLRKELKVKSVKLDQVQLIRLHCGKVYTVGHLDQLLKPKQGEDQRISPLMCPACNKPLPLSAHFCQLANKMLQDVATAKDSVSQNLLSYEEKAVIQTGMERFAQLYGGGMTFKRSKKAKHHVPTSSIISYIDQRSPDTLLMMQFLQSVHTLCTTTVSDVQARELRSTILELIAQTHGKTSPQIIKDVQSEIFRLSLGGMLKEFQDRSGYYYAGPQNLKQVGSVQVALEAMEEDHQLRLSEEQYQEHLHVLQRAAAAGSYLSLPRLPSLTIPEITKGEWYKCAAAGHFYFKPAQYRRPKDKMQCWKCLEH